MVNLVYKTDLHHVDWVQMKTKLRQDGFDNRRSPEQLKTSLRSRAIATQQHQQRSR
jgi:hypothetical protein